MRTSQRVFVGVSGYRVMRRVGQFLLFATYFFCTRMVCAQTRGLHCPSIFQFWQESKRNHLDAMKRRRDALQADTEQELLDK